MFVDEYNEKGEVVKQREISFDLSMMLPAFKGVDAVAAVEGLCNPRGFVIVDELHRSPKYKNILLGWRLYCHSASGSDNGSNGCAENGLYDWVHGYVCGA